MNTVATKPVNAARFLCRAAWRCSHPGCDTPWFATETYGRAKELAQEHDYLIHDRRRP